MKADKNSSIKSNNTHLVEMFLLTAENFTDEKFYVVSFKGYEALNELFNFSIDFVCTNKSLNINTLMSSLTTFSIVRKNGEITKYSGYPINIEQSGHFGKYAYYHIDLRPTFWKMTQLSESRIFLNKNIKEIIKEILTDEKFLYFPNDFNFVKKDYPKQEFVMQYNETNFDFISWILEQNGAYFYFDQDSTNPNAYKINIDDKIIFADQPASHNSLIINNKNKNSKLKYSEVSGLDFVHSDEIIYSFKLKQSPLPKNIVVRDYDWKQPNRIILGKAEVSAFGLGTIYLTNENVESEAEANRIAKIRAEELQCHSKTYYGKSVIPILRPGFTFELSKHYNKLFDQEYLITKVIHEGSQESFLSLGLGIPMQKFRNIKNFSTNLVEHNDNIKHYFYHNDFECIEADQVYHPKRTAPRAEIKGVISGFIDGAGDSSRPEVDEFGRYKVVFPFDISGRNKGKASCWIRRSQEQVGQGSGLNFPLLGGVEVTISFINGNPNLPIISGALANGETQSLAQNNNTNIEGIVTAGGNRLIFNNKDKKQSFALQTAAGRGLSFGAGSLSQSQQIADYTMGITTALSTSVHGIATSQISGMKKTDVVYSPLSKNSDTATWLSVTSTILLEAIQNVVGKVAKNDAEEIANTTLKAIQVVVETIFDRYFASQLKSAYAATLNTTEDTVFSKIATLPSSLSNLIAWEIAIVAPTLLNSIENIVDDAEGITDQQYQDTEKEYKEALDKFQNDPNADNFQDLNDKLQKFNEKSENTGKTATTNKYINSIIGELIPELIALATTIHSYKNGCLDKKHLGGVLLHSEDANITLASRDPIALHTARGVLINTEDIPVKDKNLNSSDSNSKDTFKSYDDTLNSLNKGNYLKWGIADKDGKLPNDYEEGNASFTADEKNENSLTGFLQKKIFDASNYTALNFQYKSAENYEEKHNVMKKRFVATQTEHIINIANYSTDIFSGQKYNVAYSFVYSTKPSNNSTEEAKNNGKGITQMRLHSKDDDNALNVIRGYQPTQTGFIVDVFDAENSWHSITLRTHALTNSGNAIVADSEGNNYETPSSWLNLSEKVAEISVAKDANKKQMIKATNEQISIGIAKNDYTNNDVDVGLVILDDSLILGSKNTDIMIDDEDIVVESKKTQINGITIQKTKINDVSEINGKMVNINNGALKIVE